MNAEIESVTRVDWEDFRKRLAFPFSDTPEDENSQHTTQEFLIKLCATLPKFYGDELDRLRLWDRISTGLEVLASKLSDTEEIMDIMLKHVCADVSVATSDRSVILLLSDAEKLTVNMIKNIINRKKIYIICKARDQWTSRFQNEAQ